MDMGMDMDMHACVAGMGMTAMHVMGWGGTWQHHHHHHHHHHHLKSTT
jgi:hypothetical protein